MATERKIVKYDWHLVNKFLSSTTWLYSEQFLGHFERGIGFDIGLKMTPDYELLKVRVRKNDARSASAAVLIEISEKKRFSAPMQYSSQHYLPYEHSVASNPLSNTPNNIFILRVTEQMSQNATITDWTEQCTLDRFSKFSKENNHQKLSASLTDCCIKELLIHCTIEWHGLNKPNELTTVSFEIFEPFFNSNTFSDIVIKVKEHLMPAHKVILAAHSPYFKKMFTTDMKESKENFVEIKRFPVEDINELMEFFYTNKTKASEDVDIAMKMIPIADIYKVESLKNICEATLSKKINQDNVLNILCIADDFHVAHLRECAMAFMEENRRCIVKLPEFHELCLAKPEIMFEFTSSIGSL